ncbi:MAG TPA: hypothetical protein VGK03_09615 [Geothrix sp.]|jgi:hypothetical protein
MTSRQDIRMAKPTPKPILLWLGAGVLTLNLFVILMGGISLRQSWHNQQDRAILTAQNLAQLLDRYVADTFSKADLALWAVKDEIERSAGGTGGPRDLDAFIRRQHERTPGLLAIRTVNAQGIIEHGTGTKPGISTSIAEREHFIRTRDDPRAGSVISKPVLGKISGQWLIPLDLRLERPDHGFAGIVYAAIDVDQFGKDFSALDVGQHGSIAIRGLDLGLVSRYPAPATVGTAVGEQIASQELRAFAQSGQSTGIFRARSPFDHIQRTVAIRRVSGLPFYVRVGLAEQDYLAGWRREVLQELMELFLFTCLTLAASWVIYRAWVRQQIAHDELEKLLAAVKTLGGMVPICSHCKKIRDDKGYWNQIEAYLAEHTDAEFTHGICPDCAKEVFPRSSGKHTAL